eukprot:7044871-Prymnesium_polylepis.1
MPLDGPTVDANSSSAACDSPRGALAAPPAAHLLADRAHLLVLLVDRAVDADSVHGHAQLGEVRGDRDARRGAGRARRHHDVVERQRLALVHPARR